MALVSVGKGLYRDTDELEQAEYYYYCKARKLRPDSLTYIAILEGRLDADTIETDPRYEWLRD